MASFGTMSGTLKKDCQSEMKKAVVLLFRLPNDKTTCESWRESKTRTHFQNGCHIELKRAVVLLTRLPGLKGRTLPAQRLRRFYSEDETLGDSEPGDDGSDWSASRKRKRVKMTKRRTRANSRKGRGRKERSPPPPPPPPPSPPPPPAPGEVQLSTSYFEYLKDWPKLPEQQVLVDMKVLARKDIMRWERGQILKIDTNEMGQVEYTVCFQAKDKSLMCGHHMAFDHTPTLAQLYIGARVVIQCQTNRSLFLPGILAELPNRKNTSRFLVFLDDHTPLYVQLPRLHLVCRPLEDVLENLPDDVHRWFMRRYLHDWPFPHLTEFTVGGSAHVDVNGIKQSCTVKAVDASLVQVEFENQESPHKEWIYRGSVRLQTHKERILSLRR